MTDFTPKREIYTGRLPVAERLHHSPPPTKGIDVATVATLPPVHAPQPFAPESDSSIPAGPIAGLIESLNRNAAFLSGIVDTARVVSSPHVEDGALRLFANNPDLSLTTLNMLNDLVAAIAVARAKILLAQKE